MAIFKLERSAVIALTVACALFMENLDGTVIATALPQIGRPSPSARCISASPSPHIF